MFDRIDRLQMLSPEQETLAILLMQDLEVQITEQQTNLMSLSAHGPRFVTDYATIQSRVACLSEIYKTLQSAIARTHPVATEEKDHEDV